MQSETQLEGKQTPIVAATRGVENAARDISLLPETVGVECPDAPPKAAPNAAPNGWIVLALLLLIGMGLASVPSKFMSRPDQTTRFIQPPVFEMDINGATAAQLRALPEVGEMLAQRLVDYREANGPFRRTDDLLLVRGFGPTTLQRLESMVAVNADTSVK